VKIYYEKAKWKEKRNGELNTEAEGTEKKWYCLIYALSENWVKKRELNCEREV
jgi:hypothetical protein